MKTSNLKSQLPAIREAINAALIAVAKQQGLTSLTATKCKYDTSGNFTFSVDGVVEGGLDKEAAAYEQMKDLLGLPNLGTVFTHRNETSKIIGLNSTGTKVITDKGGKKYIWPVDSIKKICNVAPKVEAVAPKRERTIEEIAQDNVKQPNGFTTAQMSAAFDRVKDKLHWKRPVNCLVAIKDSEDERLISEAVIFYTGSVPTFTRMKGESLVRVRAAGYYATIGA